MVNFVRALGPFLSVKVIIIKALAKIHGNVSWKIQADAYGQLQPLGVQSEYLTIGVRSPQQPVLLFRSQSPPFDDGFADVLRDVPHTIPLTANA